MAAVFRLMPDPRRLADGSVRNHDLAHARRPPNGPSAVAAPVELDGRGGQAVSQPGVVIDARPVLPRGTGEHRVTGLGGTGEELLSIGSAMPDAVDGGGGYRAGTSNIRGTYG